MDNIFRGLLRPVNPYSILLHAIMQALVGIMFLFPTTTGIAVHLWSAESIPHALAGWGLIISAILIALSLGHRRIKFILISGWVSFLLWISITILTFLASPLSITWVLCAYFAAICGFIVINVGVNRYVLSL